jgi:hypothetical protein
MEGWAFLVADARKPCAGEAVRLRNEDSDLDVIFMVLTGA